MKVGDWVTNTEGFLFRVTENNIYASDDFTLWIPKEGEWCWFRNSTNEVPIIGQFIGFEKTGEFKCGWRSIFSQYSIYANCEPFIGTLPSFIKDKQ